MKKNKSIIHSVRRSTAAFTLIELLTVIAIIGILAAILIPVVGKVRNMASKATAISDFRQIGTAVLSYAADNKDRLPGPRPGNSGFQFRGGQQAIGYPSGNASNREYLCSIEETSIGKYLGVTEYDVWGDGSTRPVCKQLMPPALLGVTGDPAPNNKIYKPGLRILTDREYNPFGLSASGNPANQVAAQYSKLGSAIPLSKFYMLRESTDTEFSGPISKPIHGSGFVAVYFDGHVGFIPQNETKDTGNVQRL